MEQSKYIVHFHDPELLPLSLRLARCGMRLIYDAHENVPAQILSKPYLGPNLRKIIAKIIYLIESYCVRHCAAVISVTSENVNRLSSYNKKAFLVRNFPILKAFADVDFSNKQMKFLYVGGITKIRGSEELAKAALVSKTNIDFYGPLESDEIKNRNENDFTTYHGSVDQAMLFSIMNKSLVGFAVFHKVPNHLNCSPNKLFEYMASGMAVIVSDIPMWKEIIEKYKCGICVDPYNVQDIANAIAYMKIHPQEAKEMGRNGRHAVFDHYNWHSEANTLLHCYQSVATPSLERFGSISSKSEENTKIFHITTVHARYDTRIFTKECVTLAAHGYDVTLIVCDGKGNEEKNGVHIIDAGDFSKCNRFERMVKAPRAILKVLKKRTKSE